MRNRLKFSRLPNQLITMEGINFKKDLIENFIEVSKSSERFPQKTFSDINNIVKDIKKVDPEKGEIIHEFIECPINLHDGMSKATELHSFYEKCESIRKAYRLDDEDFDAVDGIMDELRQAKNKLVSFVKEAVASEQFKEIGKELFEIIVKVIRESLEQELDIKHIITRLIKLVLSSLV